MTRKESLQSQQALRTINEYIMDIYKQGKVKRRTMATKYIKLPDKYNTPDWIWEDKTVEQFAEEYVEGVKKVNNAPTWDLIHTAVCYGYELGLNARKQ